MKAITTSRTQSDGPRRWRWRLGALGAGLLCAGSTLAQGVGDTRAGREVATSLCIQCHQIDGTGRDPSRVPPGFGAVADMASQTALSLRVFLQTPHGDMPRYQLTPTETDDVIAYIQSLRSR
ncbi:MAG: cytochrome C [Hyphomicrobiales bacterium]|nr:MAG: cytochrome C [Hyphomicrobiales bacterium]